jgi:hypothetical protein
VSLSLQDEKKRLRGREDRILNLHDAWGISAREQKGNAVIPNELIQYYESLVGRQRRRPAESNPHLREYIAEIRDVWEQRVILRDLRNRAGIATCSGEVDCLGNPTSRCMGGKHPTCSSHTDSCYLCMSRSAQMLSN